jgi:hypothetical protein
LLLCPAKKPSCACSMTLNQEDGSGCFSHYIIHTLAQILFTSISPWLK